MGQRSYGPHGFGPYHMDVMNPFNSLKMEQMNKNYKFELNIF